jgi:hypothetical protein
MPTHVTNPDAEVRRAQNPGKDETVLTHEIDYPFAYASGAYSGWARHPIWKSWEIWKT